VVRVAISYPCQRMGSSGSFRIETKSQRPASSPHSDRALIRRSYLMRRRPEIRVSCIRMYILTTCVHGQKYSYHWDFTGVKRCCNNLACCYIRVLRSTSSQNGRKERDNAYGGDNRLRQPSGQASELKTSLEYHRKWHTSMPHASTKGYPPCRPTYPACKS